jgi:hypothetical protein
METRSLTLDLWRHIVANLRRDICPAYSLSDAREDAAALAEAFDLRPGTLFDRTSETITPPPQPEPRTYTRSVAARLLLAHNERLCDKLKVHSKSACHLSDDSIVTVLDAKETRRAVMYEFDNQSVDWLRYAITMNPNVYIPYDNLPIQDWFLEQGVLPYPYDKEIPAMDIAILWNTICTHGPRADRKEIVKLVKWFLNVDHSMRQEVDPSMSFAQLIVDLPNADAGLRLEECLSIIKGNAKDAYNYQRRHGIKRYSNVANALVAAAAQTPLPAGSVKRTMSLKWNMPLSLDSMWVEHNLLERCISYIMDGGGTDEDDDDLFDALRGMNVHEMVLGKARTLNVDTDTINRLWQDAYLKFQSLIPEHIRYIYESRYLCSLIDVFMHFKEYDLKPIHFDSEWAIDKLTPVVLEVVDERNNDRSSRSIQFEIKLNPSCHRINTFLSMGMYDLDDAAELRKLFDLKQQEDDADYMRVDGSDDGGIGGDVDVDASLTFPSDATEEFFYTPEEITKYSFDRDMARELDGLTHYRLTSSH